MYGCIKRPASHYYVTSPKAQEWERPTHKEELIITLEAHTYTSQAA